MHTEAIVTVNPAKPVLLKIGDNTLCTYQLYAPLPPIQGRVRIIALFDREILSL